MTLRPYAFILLAAAPLAGCGSQTPDSEPAATESPTAAAENLPAMTPAPDTAEVASEPDVDEWGAGKLSRWLNVLPTETVMKEIADTVGKRTIRTYTQGDPITMDFSAARLNVELGADGRIKVFRCG
jgi:hypothetical protein